MVLDINKIVKRAQKNAKTSKYSNEELVALGAHYLAYSKAKLTNPNDLSEVNLRLAQVRMQMVKLGIPDIMTKMQKFSDYIFKPTLMTAAERAELKKLEKQMKQKHPFVFDLSSLKPKTSQADMNLPPTCIRQSGKKYVTRSSPPYPANECRGVTIKGNDGLMYISKADKKGIFKWVKFHPLIHK